MPHTAGPGAAPNYDGSSLRIGILHSRWNAPIINALVTGAQSALAASGVKQENIVTQSVPGAYELPYAAQRMHAAAQSTATSTLVSAATDLLSSTDLGASPTSGSKAASDDTAKGPLDAIIAIGVLIKGSTMHFEYICDAVSHGLMRVQLDTGCPVIFGVLTCLTDEQAQSRAGIVSEGKVGGNYGDQGHNHGEDWGRAAVEMGLKRRGWGEGNFVE